MDEAFGGVTWRKNTSHMMSFLILHLKHGRFKTAT